MKNREMGTESGNVVTLANSIIGVGILAMPFCFQKCGILLSILLLLVSNLISRISCHFLLKSSILTRRKNFEFLALHAFGPSGKLLVELCIIGYLFGTCVAYYVVMGDLGPQIISKMTNFPETSSLRLWVLIVMTVICVIPLGLLRNIDSLSAVCTVSIGFYLCFVIKIIGESKFHLVTGDWWQLINWWQPSGVLQCLPIFSMALSCQMQLFEVSETMAGASLDRMNKTVKAATGICTLVYILVGFFGYVAFCTLEFSGNILVNFSQSISSDIIKIGFVISIAFSFPLVIFPCRASLYSLLYRRGHIENTQFIPELKFKTITIAIVLISMVVGIYIPSIELVIGIVGSTIGVATCIVFPASCFSKVSKKESTEKVLAKFLIVFGFCLMSLGTYANLSAIDEKTSHLPEHIDKQLPAVPDPVIVLNPIVPDIRENLVVGESGNNIGTEEKRIGNFDKTKEKIAKLNAQARINASLIEQKPIERQEPEKKVTEEKLFGNEKEDIAKDAIRKEEEEIKADEKELKAAVIKEELNAVVDEIKRRNEETQKLVLEKLEEIVDKIEHKDRGSEEKVKNIPPVEIKANANAVPNLKEKLSLSHQNREIPFDGKNLNATKSNSELSLNKGVRGDIKNSLNNNSLLLEKFPAPIAMVLNKNISNSLRNVSVQEEVIPIMGVVETKTLKLPKKTQPIVGIDMESNPEESKVDSKKQLLKSIPEIEKTPMDANRRDLLGIDKERRRKRNAAICEKHNVVE